MSTKTFEEIKHTNEYDAEFWYARELQEVLQYKEWRNFEKVVDAARVACRISKHEVDEHFVEYKKEVLMPGGGRASLGFVDVNKPQRMQKVKDYQLSRYACYLIVMNGDPRKEIIAQGQTYFAVKNRV